MRKIKVIHILYELGVGGAENGVVNLVNRMNSKKFSAGILTFIPGGKLAERVDKNRVFIIDELHKREGNDWRLPLQLAKIFRREKPDVIHTHAWVTLVESFLASKIARVPVWIHGEHGTMQKKPLNRKIQRFVWGRAHRVLSVSEVLADQLADTMGFPRKKIQALVNGVALQKFKPKNRCSKLRDSLQLGQNDFLVGIVGRLEPVKDHASFLRAILHIKEKSHLLAHKCYGLIVGDGSQAETLRELANKIGVDSHIKFLGRRTDVPELLQIMDVSVCSSLSEGMSNTILEAMASGLPIVATNVGGNPELVLDGKNGILVPANNPEKLGKTLINILQDQEKRQTMGKTGREYAESRFDLDRMIHNYESLYESFF